MNNTLTWSDVTGSNIIVGVHDNIKDNIPQTMEIGKNKDLNLTEPRGNKYRRKEVKIPKDVEKINFTASGNLANIKVKRDIVFDVSDSHWTVNAFFTIIRMKNKQLVISTPGKNYDLSCVDELHARNYTIPVKIQEEDKPNLAREIL